MVLLRLLLLREMAFAVRNDLSHMWQVVFVVLLFVLFGVLFEDFDDLAAAVGSDSVDAQRREHLVTVTLPLVAYGLARAVVFTPSRASRFF